MRPLAMRAVLAATDLTEGGDRILRGAAALASLTGAELHVVHALDLPALPYLDGRSSTPLFEGWMDAASATLAHQIERALPAASAPASCEVLFDAPERVILNQARVFRAELIVLGRHRERPGAGVLGTTADRVIRTAQAPCLILHEGLSLPLRRVVVPIDLSEPARAALEQGLFWASAFAASAPQTGLPTVEVRVLHVIPRLVSVQGLSLSRALVGPQLSQEVAEVVERCGVGTDVEVRQEVVWGKDAAEEILRYASEEGADLLVLGTHGYGAIRRMLIGSVASAVARQAPCPVLLVPPALWRGTAASVGISPEREEPLPLPA